MVILGIESSCDETSIAILKDGKEILSNKIFPNRDTQGIWRGSA